MKSNIDVLGVGMMNLVLYKKKKHFDYHNGDPCALEQFSSLQLTHIIK
jgi:hypothetical protein